MCDAEGKTKDVEYICPVTMAALNSRNVAHEASCMHHFPILSACLQGPQRGEGRGYFRSEFTGDALIPVVAVARFP